MISTILISLFIGDVLWWWCADVLLRKLARAKWWRASLAIFMGFQVAYLLWIVLMPTVSRRSYGWMPMSILAGVYLWHLLIMPLTLVILGVVGGTRAIARAVLPKKTEPSPGAMNRRQFLAGAAAALPPIVTAGAVAVSIREVNQFRIRPMTIALRELPAELDGMTIAHVSDLHIGRFARAAMIPKVIEATNRLKADLVLFTGDLIDLTLSDLPAGVDFIRRLDPKSGLALIEGNHDLIEDREQFELRSRAAGLPLLLDQTMSVKVRGRDVQLLGLTWNRGARGIDESMARLLPQRRPEQFQILLAHHPHAFDPAANTGIPLTLSGHTHGGQLMLNERLGAGPVMFRYWSGEYRKANSALVVSNGVGNWFPLRTHAPAEIVHLTLRRAV